MSRTNIDIDDELIGRVMRRYDFRSKREAVESALRGLDVEPLTHKQILALEGTGWSGDLEQMRSNRAAADSWLARE